MSKKIPLILVTGIANLFLKVYFTEQKAEIKREEGLNAHRLVRNWIHHLQTPFIIATLWIILNRQSTQQSSLAVS